MNAKLWGHLKSIQSTSIVIFKVRIYIKIPLNNFIKLWSNSLFLYFTWDHLVKQKNIFCNKSPWNTGKYQQRHKRHFVTNDRVVMLLPFFTVLNCEIGGLMWNFFSSSAVYLLSQVSRPPKVKFLTLSQKTGSSLSYGALSLEDNYIKELFCMLFPQRIIRMRI